MEGLVKLLIEINKAIRLPAGTEPPSFGKDAVPAIAKFYALTFFFLGEFMDWYARKAACRLLQSHSLDPYSDFHTLISCIKETTRGMDVNRVDMDDGECERETRILKQNAPHLWEEARLNQVGLNGSDRRFASQNAMLHQLIWEIQHDAAQRVRLKMERELRLLQLQNSVRGQFSAVPDQSSGIACLMATRTQDLDASGAECAQSPKRKFTRIDLQLASRHLDGFFDSDHWIADFGSDIELMAENNVATSLQEWITDSRPQFLAVGGSPTTAFCSPAALISGCYASFARRFKVPVISHFCSLPSQAAEGITPAQQGVVSLTYSLIRQLVDYLPPVLDCSVTCDLSAERFSLLDGTLTSWKEVLSLIDILLHYAPPLLVCVIDGLDALQDSTTKLYVQSLIRVFLTHMRYHSAPMPDGSKSFPVLLKVLFTVAGKLGPLEEVLAENQRVTSEPLQTPPLISDADAVITSA
ncbi:hypothetical protein PHISCL_06184 [Aspergillus sclerotialis]|uniref:Uncharacterized protein n=1 Tax=Aspergillus sclerotialis TaxID=2070753 RepID=A0A3A2ZEC3_9EURO|nr:hypothetical protein PHISCL_06184 [Aspergillus sclerotialis]